MTQLLSGQTFITPGLDVATVKSTPAQLGSGGLIYKDAGSEFVLISVPGVQIALT